MQIKSCDLCERCIYTKCTFQAVFQQSPTSLAMSPKLSRSIITQVITLLENRIPGAQIATKLNISPASISSIRKIHLSHLPKSQGGCPRKLKPSNVDYAVHLVTTGKAKTASEITPILSNVIQQSLHPKTVCRAIKTRGL